jgi:2-polyprenyl-3-methyl-5-hydroxy-6-metoxy-1,4-benzoquinol methylase
MAESNALTRQFDDAAQLYDEVRPRYPEPIVEQIIAFAALPAHGRIFEVGCGTGQMTLPFAQRGYTMVAIRLHREPPATMARRGLSAGIVHLRPVWRAPRSPNIMGTTVLG